MTIVQQVRYPFKPNCEAVMQKKRKINRWDRRRANKRLRRLKDSEKYKKTESTLDSLNIRLPELTEKQKKGIEDDLIKKGKKKS
jgi:hypothetical protein